MAHLRHFVLFFLLASINLNASAYEFEVDGIYYDIVSEQDLTCGVSESDDEYSGDVVIPEFVTYEGKTYTVTTIGERAFYKCTDLTSLTIPSTVVEIEDWAFRECL